MDGASPPLPPHAVLWSALALLVKRRCFAVHIALLRDVAGLPELQFEAGLRTLRKAHRITISDRQVHVCVQQPEHLAIAEDAAIPRVRSIPGRPRLGARRNWSLEHKGLRRCKHCRDVFPKATHFGVVDGRHDPVDYLCLDCRANTPFRNGPRRAKPCTSQPTT
jgi:hypothetical protein